MHQSLLEPYSMLETLAFELTFRAAVARRSRNNFISLNSSHCPRKMCKNIRHVEFISPAPTSEKCKQIHTNDITIQTQHPVFSNLCVKQTVRVTEAVQRTSYPEKQSLETFPLDQSGTIVSRGKLCFHWGLHDFQHCYFCRWHSLKIIFVMLWGTLRDKRARFDGQNIVSTPLSRVSRQLQRRY